MKHQAATLSLLSTALNHSSYGKYHIVVKSSRSAFDVVTSVSQPFWFTSSSSPGGGVPARLLAIRWGHVTSLGQ